MDTFHAVNFSEYLCSDTKSFIKRYFKIIFEYNYKLSNYNVWQLYILHMTFTSLCQSFQHNYQCLHEIHFVISLTFCVGIVEQDDIKLEL